MKVAKTFPFHFLELITIGVMLIGLLLRWLHIDEQATLLHMGFLLFGIAGNVILIRSKEPLPKNIKAWKMLINSTCMGMVIAHFITGRPVFHVIVLMIILQYFLSQRKPKPVSDI
jgi:hypothetical protein